MSEPKKNPNPFIAMAQEAKRLSPRLPGAVAPKSKAPKPSKGFGGAPVRKTGRGG
jgi:hypothetical protein